MITETNRLRVRELAVEDAAFILRLTNEPSFLANIGDKGVRTLEDAKRFILEGFWTRQQKPGYGQFLVVSKESGEALGVCGLLYRERLEAVDIGFAFLPEHQGGGFALEAARAVMAYGHSVLGVDRIVGLTTKANLPSIRLLERLGLKFREMITLFEDDPGTALYY